MQTKLDKVLAKYKDMFVTFEAHKHNSEARNVHHRQYHPLALTLLSEAPVETGEVPSTLCDFFPSAIDLAGHSLSESATYSSATYGHWQPSLGRHGLVGN